MKIQVIGCGAAGNKATISAYNCGILTDEDILLVNSTPKDIQEEYRKFMITLSDSSFGCAKERRSAQKLTIKAFESGRINLEEWVLPTTDTIVLVASTDGGTGSGSLTVFADYIYNQMHINVNIITLNGFEDDETGLKNTISLYKELDEHYTYQTICNTKFLKEANNNKLKAQELANAEFCNRLLTLQGAFIIESENNVDDADLLKTVLTPGFMDIEYKEFNDIIRNVDDFNAFLNKMCDETKSFDILEPSQRRMAVIVNLNSTPEDAIDWSFTVLRERYGHVKELFSHLQNNSQTEFIAFISAGMNFPEHSLERIYKAYEKERTTTKKKEDKFFLRNKNEKFVIDDEDDDDDILYRESPSKVTSKSIFFASQVAATKEKEKNFKNKDKKDVDISKEF